MKKANNGKKTLSEMDPDEVLREHERLCRANADKYKYSKLVKLVKICFDNGNTEFGLYFQN